MVVLEISRKLTMDTLDLEMVINDDENGLQIQRQGKNWITHDQHS